MISYRLYLFDGRRLGLRRATRTIRMICSDERDALRRAEKRREGQYGELWRQEQIVRVFQPD